MATAQETRSAKVRARIGHPVVDADGHLQEAGPVLMEYVREVGGGDMVQRFATDPDMNDGRPRSLDERRKNWARKRNFWGSPTDAVDWACVTVPKLLHERMDEFGMDFTILYPSQGLFVSHIQKDSELRRVACRAYNLFAADLLRDYADRMAGVAVIPMHTPQEALEELDYVVNVLGFKVVNLEGTVLRPIPGLAQTPSEEGRLGTRMELFALDSEYDYDPVWARCVELKVAATFHTGLRERDVHSITNYVYNHIGFVGNSHARLAKALFMGGVTNRFPTLRFGFLEGGVSWATNLYADIVAHWEKRNGKAIHQYDPARLDRERVMELIAEYGDDRTRAKMEEMRRSISGQGARPEVLDEFAACGMERAEEILDRFVSRFYFGCEADDTLNAQAFASTINPFNARLKAVIGSDIGHWDVPVMNDVIGEAYELVERGSMTDQDFKDFVFTNPVSLHAGMNPDFFKGTRVEKQVAELLKVGI